MLRALERASCLLRASCVLPACCTLLYLLLYVVWCDALNKPYAIGSGRVMWIYHGLKSSA